MGDTRFWITEQHNRARAAHGVGPLQQNSALNQNAQNWANHLASRGAFQHSDGNWNGRHVGENIFMAMDSRKSEDQLAKDQAVFSWYDEIRQYNFGRPGFTSGTGHFTQVVWRGSKELGIGIASGRSGTYVVCQYFPAGNMQGDFPNNVPQQKSQPNFSCSGPTVTLSGGINDEADNGGGDGGNGNESSDEETQQQSPCVQQQSCGGVQKQVQTQVKEETRNGRTVRTTITTTTERYPDGSTRTSTQTQTQTF